MSKLLDDYESKLQVKLDAAIAQLEETLKLIQEEDKFFGLAWPTEGRLWKLNKTCERILSEFRP